jgi:hypothetical protein
MQGTAVPGYEKPGQQPFLLSVRQTRVSAQHFRGVTGQGSGSFQPESAGPRFNTVLSRGCGQQRPGKKTDKQ